MKNSEMSPKASDLSELVNNQTQTGKSSIINATKWVDKFNIPFFIGYYGIIIMLLWAGAYKLTTPGADGIVPLVTNSPLISWNFEIFGTYVGSDLIGITELTSALLILSGYFYPKAGIVGTFISIVMFTVTSTMVITTPGSITIVKGIGYMSFLGLFLFKDILSMGVSFYLLSYFRQKAVSWERKAALIGK